MNRIKDEQIFPECLEICNVSSIWKKKASRNNFESYRGIFRVTIFRSILDRLIYNDEYENLDKSLTDCNVGARKERNIRDNIFVINAITNNIKKTKSEEVDFQVYDIEKCFDKLWLHEVINCLYSAGFQNDKLPLLFLENKNAKVAIKTASGISNRISIKEIIMQGSVFGSICCVVLMDKLGQYIYNNPELLYYYKGVVATPPLQMVDDILGIQRCSKKSRNLNNTINTFIELEKLRLSKKKCSNIHIGKNDKNCQEFKVHGDKMKKSPQETYLGDKIDRTGMIKPTVMSRKAKAFGAVTHILAIVNEVPLAHWKVEAGLQLRQAMLLSVMLFNSEAWHGVSDTEIEQLEKVDKALLRGLLNAHSKAPLESIYLETGCIPIRFIIKSRRLSYLHNILQKDREELIREVFEAQKDDPKDGDFVKTIREDAKIIGLETDENEVAKLKKEVFKKVCKSKVRSAALHYLNEKKQTHSKVKNIEYKTLEPQTYLKSPLFNTESWQLLFALRTRTVKSIKSDFKNMYQEQLCPLGCGDIDTLQNLLTCSVMSSKIHTDILATHSVQYEDIYSEDITKQKEVTELYTQLLQIREELITSSARSDTGQCINLQEEDILSVT